MSRGKHFKNAGRSEALTGCLSHVSLPSQKGSDFYSAVKRYSELTSVQPKRVSLDTAQPSTKMDFAAMTKRESMWLDVLEKKRTRKKSVSEDDVELHGYLGWLHS